MGLGLGLGSELGLSLGFGFGFGLEFRSLPEASAGEKPMASAGSGACRSGACMVVGVSYEEEEGRSARSDAWLSPPSA